MGTLAIGARASGRVWRFIAFCAWVTAVLICWGWLTVYGYTPGASHAPPSLHNVQMPFEPIGGRHLLVMAIHPKCPCSRASIGELERLLSRFRNELTCTVLVYQPQNERDNWVETDLVASARSLPNTNVLIDVDGRRALELCMSTSGAVVLYSPDGLPQYWGGITAGRGHYGDNLGADSITSILSGQRPSSVSQPVYGCRIQPDPKPGDG